MVTYKLTLTPAPDVFLDGIGAGVRTRNENLRRVLRSNSVITLRGTHVEKRRNHESQLVLYSFAFCCYGSPHNCL